MKKYVLVGCGMRGVLSYAVPMVKEFDDCATLAGVYDPNKGRMKLVSRLCEKDIPIFDDFDVMLDEKQVADMSVEQIHDTIKNALHFDVWEWNKQNGVKTFGDLVTGLNNLLFDCVYCHGKMEVCDGKLTCSNCGKQWDIDEYYRLSDGKTELTIAEWFDKQRQYISKQLKDGDFVLKGKAKLQVLDGYKGFKQAGSGVFSQDLNGVTFDGTSQNKPCKLNFDASKHWSAPAGNGFVELSQYGNTYRFVFDEEGIAIKSALAVEESFKLAKEKVQIDF